MKLPSGKPASVKWTTVGGRTSAYVAEVQKLPSKRKMCDEYPRVRLPLIPIFKPHVTLLWLGCRYLVWTLFGNRRTSPETLTEPGTSLPCFLELLGRNCEPALNLHSQPTRRRVIAQDDPMVNDPGPRRSKRKRGGKGD
ncbi:hypothetical protein PAXRUDRAFT_415348 [Paxillus rubicundulus Ve08.2h10]|uniref:Uncharacterized protein n=1 Tax=Paxillus rubicundulus Ve08.2h10 TaxID=930991 RepID=A0A0D0ECS8_9AGAM|nr:hypothetical protein PAXRUDRAFT_415348 [Paxillus rubicundulus Ve08.2h10]